MEVLQGKIECLSEETGYDSSRIDALNEHFARLIDKEVIYGAQYTIAHKGKIIANGSLGTGNVVTGEKMQPDTIFRIASMTKPITTVAIMKLIEDGYLLLNSRVSEVLPQFKEKPFHDISIWHLLTHTSGLYPDPGCFRETGVKTSWQLVEEGYKLWNGEGEYDWVKAGISGGLRREVGTQWQYCSFGFALLGEIITKVTGQFAHEYIAQNILEPLKMKDSGFDISPEMAKRMYVRNERQKERLDAIIAGRAGDNGEASFWDKIPSTAGGVHSTTGDMIRFANMMLHNGRSDETRILGRKSVERMTTQQLKNIPDYCWGAREQNRNYGIGFDMRTGLAYSYSEGTYMHEGAGTCSMNIDPKEQLAAVWFTPWNKGEWCPEPLYHVQNIIWSGLI